MRISLLIGAVNDEDGDRGGIEVIFAGENFPLAQGRVSCGRGLLQEYVRETSWDKIETMDLVYIWIVGWGLCTFTVN